MKKRKERIGMRETSLLRPSKTLEGREERLLESRKESNMKVYEDGMKKK